MKRLLLFCLAYILIFSFSGCSLLSQLESEANSSDTSKTQSTSSEEQQFELDKEAGDVESEIASSQNSSVPTINATTSSKNATTSSENSTTSSKKATTSSEKTSSSTVNYIEKAKSSLIKKYGSTSQKAFTSCAGTDLKSAPSHTYGIVSIVAVDLNNDNAKELFVVRVAKGQYGDAALLTEIYKVKNGNPKLTVSQEIYSVDYCRGVYVYLFYSNKLSKYCILVDTCSKGAYTGVDTCLAKLYTVTSSSVKEYNTWEPVPFSGDFIDFDAELKKVGAPYAKYCTQFDSRKNASYFQPLCEITHTLYGESDGYITTNHKLTIKDVSGK